jgi:hypothetical protein
MSRQFHPLYFIVPIYVAEYGLLNLPLLHLMSRVQTFSEKPGATLNCRRQMGDIMFLMKTQIREWRANLTAMCRSLFGACELSHIFFVCNEKAAKIVLKLPGAIIWNLSAPAISCPGICAAPSYVLTFFVPECLKTCSRLVVFDGKFTYIYYWLIKSTTGRMPLEHLSFSHTQ